MHIASHFTCASTNHFASLAQCDSIASYSETIPLENLLMSLGTATQNTWRSRMPSWISEASQAALASRGLTEPLDAVVQIGIVTSAMSTWSVNRGSSLCLLFAGASAAACHAQAMGLSTGTVEYSYEIQQDVTTLCGLFFAAFQVLRLDRRGLLWCSPECRTWLSFLTRYTYSRRDENDWHGTGHRDSQKANHCAIVMPTA